MSEPKIFHSQQSAERFLAALVESSEDAIIGKDLDGIVITWNAGAERLYGYSETEMRGRSIGLLIPESQGNELAGILSTIRAGQVARFETKRRTKAGRIVDVLVTISPVLDADQTIVGAATIARDITAQVQAQQALRESEQRWRAVVASAVDAVVVIDGKGLIESFNSSAELLFGYSESEIAGVNVSVLMPSPYRDEHDGYLERYQSTNEPRIIGIGREVTGRHRDGTTFPIHLAVGEMRVGGMRKFTGIIHDLRPRVRIEEQLRERTAMARLGEMAAVVAHEVKNPLAGIRGAIQVLGGRMPAGSRDAGVAQQVIERIDGLNELVEDLLVFARPPMPRLAPVDLAVLATSSGELLARDPLMRDVHVTYHGRAADVMADAAQLKIVICNVMVNGAQAMQGRGAIDITLETRDERAWLTVRDTGPGIAPDIRDKVFTPFFTTKSRGTGLGLPTARQLIEAQGGTIQLECPDSGGTLVTMTFPLAAAVEDATMDHSGSPV